VTSRTRHGTARGGFGPQTQSDQKCSGASSGKMPFLGHPRALSGVAGDQVATFPHPASRGAPCGRTRGFHYGPCRPLTSKVPFHSSNLPSAITEVHELKTELERQRAEGAESRAAAQKTEDRLAAYIKQHEGAAERHKFVVIWAGILAAVGACLVFGLIRFGACPQVLVIGPAVLGIAWLWFADCAGRRSAAVKDWPLFAAFGRFRVWVYSTLLLGIFLGVLGNAAWDSVKRLWAESPQGSKSDSFQTLPHK